MDVADTNMLKGSEPYEAMRIDSFTFFDEVLNGEIIAFEDQQRIYSDIETQLNEFIGETYENNPDAAVIVVDIEETVGEEGIGFMVRFAHSIRTGNCDCDFLINRPWSDLDPNLYNCGYFDDQSNNFYSNCIAVKANIGYYYDTKIEQFPQGQDIYFPESRIYAGTSVTVYIDNSMTPTEQIATRDYFFEVWNDYTLNHADGRNELLKVTIGGTIGFSNAFYLDRVIRSKYSSTIPF